jgi:hypothetical protein
LDSGIHYLGTIFEFNDYAGFDRIVFIIDTHFAGNTFKVFDLAMAAANLADQLRRHLSDLEPSVVLHYNQGSESVWFFVVFGLESFNKLNNLGILSGKNNDW